MAVKDVILAMEEVGFTSVILPFIIVFTVVYAVLQKSRVLGVDKEGRPKANYNAMVAFVVAFFSLIMFRMINVMAWFIRYGVLLLVAFVFIGIVLSFIGGRAHLSGAIKAIALALILFVLLEALVMGGVLDETTAYTMILPLLVAVFIAGCLIAIMMGKKEKAKKPEKKEEKKGKKVEAGKIKPGEEVEI